MDDGAGWKSLYLNFWESIYNFNKSIKINPNDANVFYNLGATYENLKKNNIDNVELIKDDKVPKNKKFDLIISNINRNVILKSFEAFIETEAKEFILSGFLETDFEILLNKIKDSKFQLTTKKNKNGWLMLRTKK